jgi:hypothetical protein
MTLRVVVAHESGDGITIAHCPFCGSGQVIGRSDGNTECSFCNSAFLVRVQPMFSAFPQSIDGMPVQIPGMPAPTPGMPPGADQGDPGAMPPGADGENPAEGGEDGGAPPFGGGSDSSDSGSDTSGPDDSGSKDSGGPPFGKKESVFQRRDGSPLTRTAYVSYLAGLVGGQR